MDSVAGRVSRADYRIRLARAADLARLAEIERRAAQRFAATPYPEFVHSPPLALAFLEGRRRDGAVWVAIDVTDAIVGFAVAGDVAGLAYLHEVDVDPSHGGRGLGRLLIEASLAWARRRGAPAMALSTFADVPFNAPYYERLGFVIVPEHAMSPPMLEVRRHEAEAGLPVERRVTMQMAL